MGREFGCSGNAAAAATALVLLMSTSAQAGTEARGRIESDLSWRIVEVRDALGSPLADFPNGFSLTVSAPPPPISQFVLRRVGSGHVSFGGQSAATNAGINSVISLNVLLACTSSFNGASEAFEDSFNNIVVSNSSGQTITVVMQFETSAASLIASNSIPAGYADAWVDIGWAIPSGLPDARWSASSVNCPTPWSFSAPAGGVAGRVGFSDSIDTLSGDASSVLGGSCRIAVSIPNRPNSSIGGLLGNLGGCRAETPIFRNGFETTGP